MKNNLFVVAVVVGAFYVGKFRQWWNGRHHRKVNDAVQTIADHFGKSSKSTHKNGG